VRGVSFNSAGIYPGGLTWDVASSTSHTGDGFVPGNWQSTNSGTSWTWSSVQSFKMQITANRPAVSGFGRVAGAPAMLERRRRA